MNSLPLQPLLAAQQPLWIAVTLAIVAYLVLTLGFLALFFGVLYFLRGCEWFAKRSLKKAYLGITLHDPPEPGDVLISYETHHGLIAWSTSTRHIVAAPPEEARILLGRLLRFNMRFGWIAHGGFFIVPLAISNYHLQLQSISRQETESQLACLQPGAPPTLARTPDLAAFRQKETSPSPLLQLVGYGAAVMVPISVIYGIVGLCLLDYSLAMGSVILAAGAVFVAEGFTEPRVFSTLLRKIRDWRQCCAICGGKSAKVGPLQRIAGNTLVCRNCGEKKDQEA